MPLTGDDIRAALQALSAQLEGENSPAEIIVVGGAALVLLFNARETTKDVDAYFVRPESSRIRAAAASVASELGLPPDWLNDGAKGYLVGISAGSAIFTSPNLTVRAAALPQLLAMKLAAWRDAIDRADATLLLRQLQGSAEEIWATVRQFVPQHLLDKAAYAFEDLWESTYGDL